MGAQGATRWAPFLWKAWWPLVDGRAGTVARVGLALASDPGPASLVVAAALHRHFLIAGGWFCWTAVERHGRLLDAERAGS